MVKGPVNQGVQPVLGGKTPLLPSILLEEER
jgi:hypothetical protein